MERAGRRRARQQELPSFQLLGHVEYSVLERRRDEIEAELLE